MTHPDWSGREKRIDPSDQLTGGRIGLSSLAETIDVVSSEMVRVDIVMSRETWTSNAMLPVLPYVVRVAWLFIAGGMVRSWVTGLRERAPQKRWRQTDWECCSFSAKDGGLIKPTSLLRPLQSLAQKSR